VQIKRTMALDVGDKRIGMAITDALGVTVQGRPTLNRKTLTGDIEQIRQMIDDEAVAEIVVGHPLHMDGASSPQSQKVERFVETLREAVGVRIVLWDERLTSFAAEQHLEELGLDWRARRKHVDEVAAIFILEDYLGRQS
jgi:putative Holliday junction resolvase